MASAKVLPKKVREQLAGGEEGLDFCMTSDFPRIKMYQMCQVYSDSKRLGNRMIFKQAFRSSNETLRTNRLHGSWMELGLPSQCPSVLVASSPPSSRAAAKQSKPRQGLGPVVLIFQGFWDMKKTWKNPCSFAQKIGGQSPPKKGRCLLGVMIIGGKLRVTVATGEQFEPTGKCHSQDSSWE